MNTCLELQGICKAFDHKSGLRDIHLTMKGTEILALLGPSGCGKTTLLRIIAGLETPDHGQIIFNGQLMNSVPAHCRGFGLMFQDYALFPHLNVFKNISYGLSITGYSLKDQARRVEELLRLVGLEGFGQRDVAGLSGGEKQRVALARCLAPRPRLIMLDEPLAALDRGLREHLSLEVKRIITEVGIPSILVTHDQSEAFAMADRVAVLHHGQIIQCDKPEYLYAHPASAVVAEFLGLINVLSSGRLFELIKTIKKTGKTFLIRPDAATLSKNKTDLGIEALVLENIFRGQHTLVRCLILDSEITFSFPAPLPQGELVRLELDYTRITAWVS